MITCADGGIYVEKIKWSIWSKEVASGFGIFSENLCEPSCAEGQRVDALVKLQLSNLTEYNGKYYVNLSCWKLSGGTGGGGRNKEYSQESPGHAEPSPEDLRKTDDFDDDIPF